MPICGFNEKMLEGIIDFSEGLVEHGLIHRTKENGETIDQGIKREISDMTRLLPELSRIDDTGKRILTEGLVKYAMGFYLVMRKNGVEDGLKDYKEVIGRIGEYFKAMDNKFYSELEGKPDDMKQLAIYLNEISKD